MKKKRKGTCPVCSNESCPLTMADFFNKKDTFKNSLQEAMDNDPNKEQVDKLIKEQRKRSQKLN